MLTRPRLSIFDASSLKQRAQQAFVRQLFGFYPAALHVLDPLPRRPSNAATKILQDSMNVDVLFWSERPIGVTPPK